MKRRNSKQREMILRAAIRRFAEHGLNGTTIRDIGREAGLNSALIYYYFENKESLFRAAVDGVMDAFLERLRAQPACFPDGRERLRFLVGAVFRYYTEHPDRLRLMTIVIALHRGLFEAEIRRRVKEDTFAPLSLIGDAFRAGQWRRVDPAQAWWCIAGPCLLTLHTAGVFAANTPDMESRIEEMVDVLYEGLRPRGSSVKRRKPGKERR